MITDCLKLFFLNFVFTLFKSAAFVTKFSNVTAAQVAKTDSCAVLNKLSRYFLIAGLVEILKAKHGENETKIIQPFLPAHVMIFDVNKNGKTKLKKRLKYHAFADRPVHWQYQGIALLPGNAGLVLKKLICFEWK